MRGLEGRGVLISGGSSGIGRAAARRFVEEGSRVFVGGRHGRGRGGRGGAAPAASADGTRCDVADERVDRRSTAVGVLGRSTSSSTTRVRGRNRFVDIAPEAWDRTLEVNLRGMFLVAQAAARSMLAAEPAGGVIVNMASTNALGGEAGSPTTTRRRAASLQLTRTMAVELGPAGDPRELRCARGSSTRR